MDSPLKALNYGALSVETSAIEREHETFDIFINLKPVGDRVRFEWNYNTDIFTEASVEDKLAGFDRFLASLITDRAMTAAVATLNIRSVLDDQRLDLFITDQRREYPTHRRLEDFLREVATEYPRQVAIRCGNAQLTYQQLDTRSELLAQLLHQEGVRGGDFVGLCVDRSPDLLVAIYGILKAGAAYVPIDARNPTDRVKNLLTDAACTLMLCESRSQRSIVSTNGLKRMNLDHIDWEQSISNVSVPTTSTNPIAYVIYTSGSTGTPKGVAVPHHAAINTLFAINEHLQVTPSDRVYSVSAMSFDMSIPDYFLTIQRGATLLLADAETKKDGFSLLSAVRTLRPTVMQATPTTWKMLLLAGWHGDPEMTVIAGGEGFPWETAQQLAQTCKAVWNGYGPTETTIYATYHRVSPDLETPRLGEFVPIGRPITNVCTQILDRFGQAVPTGVPGELYIGGAGVSAGYLGRPERTSSVFVERDGMRYYRTGDRVRYLPDGAIDFMGRLDHQVKIRGYRIELGEIENRLLAHPSIRQVVVHVTKDKHKGDALAAYFVPERAEETPTADKLKRWLRQTLPGYMVPTFYVMMEKFPTTSSLKVDRKRLPRPEQPVANQSVAPVNKTEEKVLSYFRVLLGNEQIGVENDFFDFGGHSLLAVELLANIYRDFGKRLPLTTLFQRPTPRLLSALLIQEATTVWSSLVPIREKGDRPPIYLVHGGGLHVLFYRSLVQHLPEDQPVYALQAKGLDGNDEPLDRIEDMAAHFIAEIEKVQPNGPIALAGYSLGGLIAWEMAQQLQQRDRQVINLSLFDAVAKAETLEGVNGRWRKRMKKTGYSLQLLLRQPAKTLEYKRQMLRNRLAYLGGKQSIAYRDQKTNKIVEGYLPGSKKVYEYSIRAFEQYQLRPLRGVPVDLFRAEDQMFYLRDPEWLGWQPLAQGGLRVHPVPGNHYTLFDPPHDAVIGTIMRDLLER